MAKKKQQEKEDTPLVFDLNLNDTTLKGMVTRRAEEAQKHWNKEFDLDKVRKSNKKLYTSEYVKTQLLDERYQEIFNDNKMFTAIRTILPFVTSRMTQPEIVPADDDTISLKFAQDFEKILVELGEEQHARDKVKLALQDLLIGQRVGILKWVYEDGSLCLEHVDPDSIIIGNRSRLHEEPDFIQHTQERTVGDLVRQFPDKKDQVYHQLGVEKAVPSQLEKVAKITENWLFVEEEGQRKLGIVWLLDNSIVLGKMSDPNWLDKGNNLSNKHMMPFIFFNFLNDGSGYIDHTSFIEQAQYNQKQYDKRGQTIAENAAYAGIGVPVFGKGAVKEETAAKVRFSPTNRVLLDTEDVNKSFTTWTASALPAFILEDKQDSRQAVLDIFGTNQIQQGQNADTKTLGEAILMRNQAEGRQQELIDCVDNGMLRLYQIEAQMVYRYFDDVQYYNFLGEDGDFEHLAISQERIAKNLDMKIRIKAGSSLPIDRSQKIAQAVKLMENGKIGTLRLYKELGLENPEEAYKEYLREQIAPMAELQNIDKDILSREADEDLQMVIGGKEPKEREDIGEDYLTHLTEYLMTQRYEQLPQAAQVRVSQFVAGIIAQAQRKALKLSTLQPLQPQQPPMGAMPPGAEDGTMPPQGNPGGASATPAPPVSGDAAAQQQIPMV